MNEAGFRTKGVFEFLAVVFLVATVGIGVYFYQSVSNEEGLILQANKTDVIQPAYASSEEYASVIREKSKLEGENAALKAQAAQFESEKGVILNQVRTSVKAFDDYRQQMGIELNKLNDQIAKLAQENGSLRKQAAKAKLNDDAIRSEYAGEIEGLKNEMEIYRETISLLQEEIASKQDQQILIEAAKLHYNVGNFYFRNRQYTDAVQEYGKSLMYAPNDPDTHYNMAIVNDEYLGDRQTALDHYKRYLSLNPNSENVNKVEERILDLELYETVLSADKDLSASRVKFLDPTSKPDTTEFYIGS